jgi:hypothetical protein
MGCHAALAASGERKTVAGNIQDVVEYSIDSPNKQKLIPVDAK